VKPLPARLLALVPLALSAWVYHPILGSYFRMDDFLNLYTIANGSLFEFLITPHGGHLLVTRNALFYLFASLLGTETQAWFALVLLTHLLNVALLFEVIRLFTGSARLACLGAALWGMSPLHEGALAWYSVYGQVVAGALVLWILRGLARLAEGAPLSRFAPLRWSLLLIAASASFGVGIGIALLFPALPWLLLPPSRDRARLATAFAAVALLVPLLYAGVRQLYLSLYGGAPDLVPFLLGQLRQGGGVLSLWLQLLAFATQGLLLGTLAPAVAYPGAATGAVLALAAAAAALALARGPAPLRRRLLACAVIGAACYGIVAVGRVSFFGAEGNLRLVQARRLHYAGLMPLAIGLCVALAALAARRPPRPALGNACLAIGLLALVAAQATSPPLVPDPSEARRETEQVLAAIREAVDSSPPGQDVYIANRDFLAIDYPLLPRAARFPGWAAVFAIFHPSDRVEGRRVFFVETRPHVLAAARGGRRSGALLVGPEAVPAGAGPAGPPEAHPGD